ncbi:MAG: hypothetical protein ACLTXL_04640 [Clostridia bacterium]
MSTALLLRRRCWHVYSHADRHRGNAGSSATLIIRGMALKFDERRAKVLW